MGFLFKRGNQAMFVFPAMQINGNQGGRGGKEYITKSSLGDPGLKKVTKCWKRLSVSDGCSAPQ